MNDHLNLRKFVSPEIIFGNGARTLAGKYAEQFSVKKALIVTDRGLIETGWLKDIETSLSSFHIPYHIHSSVSPNPRSEEVMAGAEIYKENHCNFIIAIGGGSPMDCAKGIGIVVANKGNILDFEGVDKISRPIPPLLCIPTTAGSSADVSQFAIIRDMNEKVKISIVSKSVVPDISLIDPLTTYTMSPYLTACTGIDALVHAIEAYVSKSSGPLTDSYALDAIKIIYENLPALMLDMENPKLREQIMLASMKAGLAFSNAILGAVHAMSHSLGGYLDLPHGECNAMLLEHVINYNFTYAGDRYSRIAETMGIHTSGLKDKIICKKLMNRILDLKKDVGILKSLGEKGVSSDDIPLLADKAVKDACLITNPRKADKEDLKTIFHEAM
jgi:alcohol dehydrogenase class IV